MQMDKVLEQMSLVRSAIMKHAEANQSPMVLNVMRRAIDHLDDSALNVQQMFMMAQAQAAMVEQKAEQQVADGNIIDFPGAGNGEA